jgi:hypothetical protein
MTNDEIAEKIVDDFIAESERMQSLNITNIIPRIVRALDEKDEERENDKGHDCQIGIEQFRKACIDRMDEIQKWINGDLSDGNNEGVE